MESQRGRVGQDKHQEDEIRRKIAELQSLLPTTSTDDAPCPQSPARKRPSGSAELAPATPSPKKKRRLSPQPLPKPAIHAVSKAHGKSSGTSASRSHAPHEPHPKASSVISRLSELKSNKSPADAEQEQREIKRSSGFTERPVVLPAAPEEGATARDERLVLIENLEPGPYEHTPPFNDPLFLQFEPNSGIRLSSRSLPHEDLQDYLRGRYYLSPSRLYSAIRLLPDKQAYDVPLAGDWITIAVVAERGPIKYSRAPIEANKDEDGDPKNKYKHKQESETSKPSGKKYVNIKLVDFGARSATSSSNKATIRGDALLSLLLFEADSSDTVTYDADPETGKKPRPRKVYRGGSRGAFESMAKVKEGDVIALLNPRVLKPFQRSNEKPHPSSNILAVTPESATSIEVIGTAKDLGLCHVVRRDGKRCNSWCDKRVSDICEYHVQTAVESRRAGRAEFSIGTSGLSQTAQKRKRATDYDPRKKWGLAPDDSTESGSTYIVSGHVVNPSQMHVSETVGREAQARARRQLVGKDADTQLKSLLDRDKVGMKSVMKARAVGKQMLQEKGGSKSQRNVKDTKTEAEDSAQTEKPAKKSAYSAKMVKDLGFNPTSRPGEHQRPSNSSMQDKLSLLSAAQANRKSIELGRRPGTKVRSGVVVPLSNKAMDEHNGMVDLDDF